MAHAGLPHGQLPFPLRILASSKGSRRLHWLASTHSWRSNFVFSGRCFKESLSFENGTLPSEKILHDDTYENTVFLEVALSKGVCHRAGGPILWGISAE